MKPKTRIILLSVISILIVVTIVLGITYSFMQANIESSSVTEVSLSSCAKITLEDSGVSIDLSNTYPMSKNRALETTPYTFTVTSTCETYVGFNLYLATLNTNTLADSNIHYIITDQGTINIVAEGILSNATNAISELTNEEQTQLNSGINGTFGTIYRLYNDSIPLQGSVSYDLYLYIDSDVTDVSTMGDTFTAGIAVKSYDREAESTELCVGGTLSNCITNVLYTSDGTNGLYYHDGSGSYANADQEAGDNSYRYAGADPDNYVCFGSDAEKCPTDNLYRIIGVFGDEVKLIKYDYATSALLGTNGAYSNTYSGAGWDTSYYKGSTSTSSIGVYYWNNSTNTNTWSESNLNTVNLNTNYLSNIGSEWANLIAEHTWIVGGNTNLYSVTVKNTYNNEIVSPAESTTYNAKIGLMYVSDYGYAASPENWQTILYNYANDTNRNNNWMYMGLYDWTISRSSDDTFAAFFVYDSGLVLSNSVNYNIGVRPSFYLESSVTYNGGTGSASDPYRIA